MSRLIQLRQRIKAIETIKKVTHAMRLISMSSHTRLRAKDMPLKQYKKETHAIFHRLRSVTPEWKNNTLYPKVDPTKKTLLILIGSQKGLCGNFNSALFTLFKLENSKNPIKKPAIIAVGKKAVSYISHLQPNILIAAYDTLNTSTILTIANAITTEIIDRKDNYNSVIVFSNILKTFFSQKPVTTQLIPFKQKETEEDIQQINEDYIWEQNPHTVLDMLARQSVETELQYLLFESLMAEQAARFISMDNATRNAKNLLETSQLHYNKLRQAKITKELTELTGSL